MSLPPESYYIMQKKYYFQIVTIFIEKIVTVQLKVKKILQGCLNVLLQIRKYIVMH